MNRFVVISGLLVAMVAATPAMAGWRDYLGKTLVVEAEVTSRTEYGNAVTRGGATPSDPVSTSSCRFRYHVYVSNRLRLFLFSTRWQCDGSDASSSEKASGTIYDLSSPRGVSDAGANWPGAPFAVVEEGDDLVLDQPTADVVSRSEGSVFTVTNASGGTQMRFRFAADCGLSFSSAETFRSEYRSTDSDYYVEEDVRSNSTTTSTSCRVVDGFLAK